MRAAGRSVDQLPVPPVQCTTCLQALPVPRGDLEAPTGGSWSTLPAAPAPGTGVAALRRLGNLGDAGGLQRTGRWYLADQADRCRAVTSMRPPAVPGARCRPYRHPGTGVTARRLLGILGNAGGLQRTGRWNLVDQVGRCHIASPPGRSPAAPRARCRPQRRPGTRATGREHHLPADVAGGSRRSGACWLVAGQPGGPVSRGDLEAPTGGSWSTPPAAPAPGHQCRSTAAAGDPRRRRRPAGALLAGSGRSDRRVPRCCASAPGCSPAAPGALCRPRRRPGTRATGPVHDLLADALLTNYPRV